MNNPILAFSARRRMRSMRTPLLITLYALILAVIAYMTIYACFMKQTFTLTDMQNGVYGYTAIVALQFALIVLVAPAMTAGSVSGERERQTLDLLLVTNMSPVRLVLGKLLESFGFLALLVVSSLPVMSMAVLTGAAALTDVLVSAAFLLVTALELLSLGMFFSSLFKRTVSSTVVTYLAVFGLGVVTLLPLFYDTKRISDLYDMMIAANRYYDAAAPMTMDYIPVSFVINPLMGLLALIQAQTANVGQWLWQFSYTLGNTAGYLHYDRMYLYNMACMAGASTVLTALSALLMRTRRGGVKGRRRHA